MASKRAAKVPQPPAKTPAARKKAAGAAISKAKAPKTTPPGKAPAKTAPKAKKAPAQAKDGKDGKAEAAKSPPGRPSSFTPELGAQICEHIASGQSLRAIAALDGMPAQSTIMVWLDGRHPEFSVQYARAREAQADLMAEEILAIADDGRNDTYFDKDGNARTDTDVIQRSKLRVEARKWLASKMAPKKYGDKLGIGGAEDLGPVHTTNRTLTDAERAVRLTRTFNDNPAALQALLAVIGAKGGKK